MKSSSTSSPSIPIHESPAKAVRPITPPPNPTEQSQRSKEEEAEEAAELQQEIDQLLTSLNLEKPPAPARTSEQTISTTETVELGNVARTVYDLEKPQVNTNEKKETPNLIDRILTSRSVQIPKYSSFNPFPSRSFNENVAMNGYKLGLYAPDSTNR